MKEILMKSFASIVALAVCAGSAHATVSLVGLGAGGTYPSRGTSLGLTAFPDDGIGGYSGISSLATPIGGSIGFSPTVYAADAGSTWGTWSGGYDSSLGDIYWTGGATTLSMTLPAGTQGFAFYAEPNPFAVYTITAMDNEGHSVSQDVDGAGGAAGWWAYTDGGSALTSITVSSAVDFAVGEFYISDVPAPSSLALLGLGGLAAARRRR